MAFRKMVLPAFPPRQWAIYGPAGSGKSHLAAQMKAPALVIDADARFTEQLRHAAGDIYQLSDNYADNTDPERIAELLRQNLPGSGVRTIVIDSLTAILNPRINRALNDIEAGRVKNKISAFRDKAMSMRTLQDAVSSSGCDSLWIWHTHSSMNAQAKQVDRMSIPEVEFARLRRSLNTLLRVDVDANGQRSIFVEWARNGRQGMSLVDQVGGWRGMPELIEQAIYADGVTNEEPILFAGPEDAIAWGFEQGCWRDARHCQAAYNQIKEQHRPATAAQMWMLWIAEVKQRRQEWTKEEQHESA